MEIHVKDNAINSLEIGLEFYNKFLNNLDNIDTSISHFGNLKFSVIAIHNSIELLTKAILLDINEFLVFKSEVESDDILCNLLRNQYYNKKSRAHIAYHAVFSTNSYRTIDYGKCILLLQKIFHDKISNSNYETLRYLAEYRNTLTHLGYASTFEWYKILVVLNKSLELILNFYINNLIKSEEYFTRKIRNNIVKTLDKAKVQIQDLWMASNEHILDSINTSIELYLDNSLVIINNSEEDNEYGFYKKVDFIYNNRDKEVNIQWQFIYSCLNESIIIVDTTGLIVAYVGLFDWNLVFSYDENGIPNELEEIGILVPKTSLYFEEEKDYEISNKTKSSRLKLRSEDFYILANMYLKKLSNLEKV